MAKSEIRMAKSEFRNPKSERNPKPEVRKKTEAGTSKPGVTTAQGRATTFRIWDFGLLADFGFRISDLIRHSFPLSGIIRHFPRLLSPVACRLSPVFCLLTLSASIACATEFHVSVKGNDANPGSAPKPLRTISAAARLAQPGDVITIHQGVYRERINPPRGGESDRKRIVYQAAPGEEVELKGSEVITNWVRAQADVWKVTIPNAFFGQFNPYSDRIHGDWFFPKKGREDHTGAVYLNGEWLAEATSLGEVLTNANSTPRWFAKVDDAATTIWAQFKGVNPNEQLAESNVRQTVFFPEQTGINYLTVRGFIMRQAATPWAPPTAKQVGLIGTHWSKGWIIENNVISHSACSGIALGKYGDEWDNKSATAEGYVRTIHCALTNGWSGDRIGHHLVRNNVISHCEQAGIVGSLGAVFSKIEGNTINDIHVRGLFGGAEMAGIKIHGAIDVEIRGNHIYRTIRGIWLDWMAQGTRVSQNLLHDNPAQDVFLEVDHGPFVFDNNVFLSPTSLGIRSQGGAYVHNWFGGQIHLNAYDDRLTPFHKAHSTALVGFHDNPLGDDRYYNNVFVAHADLRGYEAAKLPVWSQGNVYLKGARPPACETDPLVSPEFDPRLTLVQKTEGFVLQANLDKAWLQTRKRQVITSELLGRTSIANLRFEQADGAPIRIDTDYFAKPRNKSNPAPGPFENLPTDPVPLHFAVTK